MLSKSKVIIGAVIVLMVIISVILMSENIKLRGKVDLIKHNLTFDQIQWSLVQLEGAISYQIDNEWSLPSHVREKVGDVLQDIMVIQRLNSAAGILSKQEENDLNSFYRKLSHYPHDNMVEPSSELSESEKEKLVQIRNALREVEWGIGYSNSAQWDSFLEKLQKLLPKI